MLEPGLLVLHSAFTITAIFDSGARIPEESSCIQRIAVRNEFCLQLGIVEQGDDPQHLLVVLVVAKGVTLGLEEGHILMP